MSSTKEMNVLIACEESQTVCKEFRQLGHKAYSCDIRSASGGHPEWHFQQDIAELLSIINEPWDMVIAFPPCTHLCSSGARWFKEKVSDGRQQAAIDFFMQFHLCAPKVAVENPIGIMSTVWRKPDQIIQPWQFGHGETKATCLWLEGLPLLKPTDVVSGRHARIHLMGPGAKRSQLRSITYKGVAQAMAEQWGC